MTVHGRLADSHRRTTSAAARVAAVILAGIAMTALAACSDDGADESGADDATERFTFEGITFEYDPTTIDTPTAEREGAPPQAPVVISLTGRDLEDAALVVTPVRGRSGQVFDDLPDDTIETVEQLEATDADDDAGDQLDFVNGTGRRIADDGTFAYTGATTDGRILVELESTLAADDEEVVARLDGLVETVYVDVASPAMSAPACAGDYELVEDVTVPAGTEFAPGEEFVKTWRIRNTGDCAWDPSWSWAFTGGDALTVLEPGVLGTVEPGEETEVSVTLRGPEAPGAYAAQFQVVGPADPRPVGPPAVVMVNIGPGS